MFPQYINKSHYIGSNMQQEIKNAVKIRINQLIQSSQIINSSIAKVCCHLAISVWEPW